MFFKKFSNKIMVDTNSVYFLYKGKVINDNLLIEKLIDNDDKQRNQMDILVYPIKEKTIIEDNNSLIKAEQIICPICGEIAKILINDYKITIFDCKNNHKKENISLTEFEKTQIIDESKIICNNCKNATKNRVYNKEFYICTSCKINLCPLCMNSHNKKHNIIKYGMKNYICFIHDEQYNSYCKSCKMNLYISCESEHSNHDIIYFGKIIQKKEIIDNKMNNLKEYINKFNEEIKNIKKILDTIMENMENYYKIIFNINNSYNQKKRNFEIINNINEINNFDNVIKDIKKIINIDDIYNKINNICFIYNKMINKDNQNKLENNNNFLIAII